MYAILLPEEGIQDKIWSRSEYSQGEWSCCGGCVETYCIFENYYQTWKWYCYQLIVTLLALCCNLTKYSICDSNVITLVGYLKTIEKMLKPVVHLKWERGQMFCSSSGLYIFCFQQNQKADRQALMYIQDKWVRWGEKWPVNTLLCVADHHELLADVSTTVHWDEKLPNVFLHCVSVFRKEHSRLCLEEKWEWVGESERKKKDNDIYNKLQKSTVHYTIKNWFRLFFWLCISEPQLTFFIPVY